MAAEYEVLLADALGQKLKQGELTTVLSSMRITRVVGAVGALVLELPWEAHPDSYFQRDHRIYVSRAIAGRRPSLLNETWYLIRKRSVRQLATGGYLRTLYAYDLNHLLARRIIAYAARTSQAKKNDQADDMMRAIVRENLGSSAGAGRDLSAYITVGSDLGAALTLKKAFAWRDVMPVLQELAAASSQQGTYLTFDMVATSETGIEFRTYTGQRGTDRSRSSSSPLILSPELGNLAQGELVDDWGEEATAVYAGGQGERSRRNVQSETDTNRIGTSPFGRIEQFINATHIEQTDTDGADDEASAGLLEARPLTMLSGTIVQQPDTTFGLHYGLGDYVSSDFTGRSFDGRLDAINVDVQRQGRDWQESISSALHVTEVFNG